MNIFAYQGLSGGAEGLKANDGGWAMWASLAGTLCQCTPWQESPSVTFHCLAPPSSAARIAFGFLQPGLSILHFLSYKQPYLHVRRIPRKLGDERSCASDPIGLVLGAHIEQTGVIQSHKQTDWEEKGERQGIFQMPAAVPGQPNSTKKKKK